MKVTLEPETEAEKKATKTVVFSGLQTVGIVGVRYTGPLNARIRKPISYSYYGSDGYEMMELIPALSHRASEWQRKIDAEIAALAKASSIHG